MVWEKARDTMSSSDKGYILFDDTVLSKMHSHKIEGVRSQYSGNAKKVIKGIGVVTCVYYNPETDQHTALDFRLFDPERDGKTKIDHMKDMLKVLHGQRKVSFGTVLMDTWYASKEMMLLIDKTYEKIYYCPTIAP